MMKYVFCMLLCKRKFAIIKVRKGVGIKQEKTGTKKINRKKKHSYEPKKRSTFIRKKNNVK